MNFYLCRFHGIRLICARVVSGRTPLKKQPDRALVIMKCSEDLGRWEPDKAIKSAVAVLWW